tara:strand:+ start:15 stop:245 length:231 start_codon:yes stop_codon:yes gene_type:complete
MDITFNGINYYIERNENESDISLYNRMLFIAKQQPKNENELKTESKYSNIWINSKLLGCQYSQKINNLINSRISNL